MPVPPLHRFLAGLLVLGLCATSAVFAAPASPSPAMTTAIVTGPSAAAAVRAVVDAGGTADTVLESAHAVVASLPVDAAEDLTAVGLQVQPDAPVALVAEAFDAAAHDVQVAAMAPGPVWSNARGRGVGVALIDTGVAETPDLAGRLVDGPDLSGDGDGLDHHGHGTFMAGLIAGDGAASAGEAVRHVGLAPSADIVSIKVAGGDGGTTLVRLLLALDWVDEHRHEFGIGVVNLSFAARAVTPWFQDPLAVAANSLATSGLVVVAASGNDGTTVSSPGIAPAVITAGAFDDGGTVARTDDARPSWSGESVRLAKPEVLAPGAGTISLRAPGSSIDREHPQARIGETYFRGSGTSMAAALTSGAVAGVLSARPGTTPDALKEALVRSGHPVRGAVGAAIDLTALDATGLGSGGDSPDEVPPGAGRGNASAAAAPAAAGTRWARTRWAGTRWAGTRWANDEWAGTRWASVGWELGTP